MDVSCTGYSSCYIFMYRLFYAIRKYTFQTYISLKSILLSRCKNKYKTTEDSWLENKLLKAYTNAL